MLVLWLCPAEFKALDIEAQYRHPLVFWNPAYWICFLPLVPCLLTGKWLHSLWGQGDMMRPDETIEESRVRLHWIYCLDGPIAFACILDLVDVIIDVPFYTQRTFPPGLSLTHTRTQAPIDPQHHPVPSAHSDRANGNPACTPQASSKIRSSPG